MNYELHSPLQFVKGIGEARAQLLESELGLRTVWDLLQHYPFRYVDRSKYHTVAEAIEAGDYVQIRGVVGPLREGGHGRRSWLNATFTDETGALELVWFKGLKWIRDTVKPGADYVIYGKITKYKGRPSMAHPEMEVPEDWMREGYKLLDKTTALKSIHRPVGERDAFHARRRLKFEELFYIQLELLLRKSLHDQRVRGYVFEDVGENFNRFYTEHLPFDLTGAQKRVLKEIRRDLKSGVQMNRLLQGDVGSGKTMVAALAALIAIEASCLCG